jgi:FtsP/CotA-like multicopper oxidase with cupredoxin domain
MLKYGALAGGAILASTKGPIPRSFASALQSPPTTPFRDPLPVPPAPVAVSAFDLDPEAAADAAGSGGIAKFYKLVGEQREVYFHKDFEDRNLKTTVWGYRDENVPVFGFGVGPTFKTFINSGVAVRLTNNLDPLSQGFGFPHLTTHLHGGHVPFRSDGFPGRIARNGGTFNPTIDPGNHFDYTYPLRDPGFLTHAPGDHTERPSTLWYHDHILDFTAQNIYRGLAGFFLVYDELDAADESLGLRLPYGDHGQYDVPMVIQDRLFGPDASLIYDSFDHNGFLGDKFAVNGKLQPYLDVQGHQYRFRLLNGSNARFYDFFLTNAAGKHFPLTLIATEGGLLDHAISVDSLLMSPSMRFEVIVDFSMFQPGEKLYLENRLAQDDGRGPRGTFEQPENLAAGTRLVEFRVGSRVPDYSQNVQPGMKLRPFAAITQTELQRVTTFRSFDFDRSHGAWTINGELAGDLANPVALPPINSPEIWTFRNKSGGWWHPQHVHSEFMRVLRRNGGSPAVVEQDGVARKDSVILGPNSEVVVYINFRDYAGPFVTHCHNAEHEDMAMMGRFDVMPSPGQKSI